MESRNIEYGITHQLLLFPLKNSVPYLYSNSSCNFPSIDMFDILGAFETCPMTFIWAFIFLCTIDGIHPSLYYLPSLVPYPSRKTRGKNSRCLHYNHMIGFSCGQGPLSSYLDSYLPYWAVISIDYISESWFWMTKRQRLPFRRSQGC